MKLLFTVFSLLLGFVPINASSTVILERYKDTNEMTIRIVGEIKLKEYSEFVKVYKSLKKSKFKLHLNAIQLDSPGGNRRAGIDIGWFIRNNKLNTFVHPDSECASACVYILTGGIIRLAYGFVGVHRSSLDTNLSDIDLLQERMEVLELSTSQYFKDMGMSSQLTTAALIVPNWTIRKLTDEEKWNWGVQGIERVHEELYFRQAAKKLGVTLDEYKEKFRTQLEECKNQARAFESVYFDCVK